MWKSYDMEYCVLYVINLKKKKIAWIYDGMLGRLFMICKMNVFVNLNLI